MTDSHLLGGDLVRQITHVEHPVNLWRQSDIGSCSVHRHLVLLLGGSENFLFVLVFSDTTVVSWSIRWVNVQLMPPCVMQWMWKIKWCSSLLLFSSFLEPATLPFVHEHMQVKIGLLAKLSSALATGQLHPLLGCQLVSLKMKCSVPGKLNMFSYLPLVW